MEVAQRNINDGIAILDVLHNGISEITESVKRLYELTVQASSETLGQDERDQLQIAANEETKSIIHTARSARFGRTNDPDSDSMMYGFIRDIDVQAGANSTESDRINIDTFDAVQFWTDDGGGIKADQVFYNINPTPPSGDSWPVKPINDVHVFDFSSAEQAQTALDKAVQQLDFLNNQMAANGASRNALSRAFSHLDSQGEALTAARSQIKDANFATETAGLVKAQIVQQSSTSVMAQANKMSRSALRLLS
jgi:flagellin